MGLSRKKAYQCYSPMSRSQKKNPVVFIVCYILQKSNVDSVPLGGGGGAGWAGCGGLGGVW